MLAMTIRNAVKRSFAVLVRRRVTVAGPGGGMMGVLIEPQPARKRTQHRKVILDGKGDKKERKLN
jgi:hypothetical protein